MEVIFRKKIRNAGKTQYSKKVLKNLAAKYVGIQILKKFSDFHHRGITI